MKSLANHVAKMAEIEEELRKPLRDKAEEWHQARMRVKSNPVLILRKKALSLLQSGWRRAQTSSACLTSISLLMPKRRHTVRLTHQELAARLRSAYLLGVADYKALREYDVPPDTRTRPLEFVHDGRISAASARHQDLSRVERRGPLTPEKCRHNSEVLCGGPLRKTADQINEADPAGSEAHCKDHLDKSFPDSAKSGTHPATEN
jgi:hypothetical protein